MHVSEKLPIAFRNNKFENIYLGEMKDMLQRDQLHLDWPSIERNHSSCSLAEINYYYYYYLLT